MKYIPYLVIFLGILLLVFAILTKYDKRKLLTTKFIDKIKYINSMMTLFLITGSILLILGLLSLLKILPINMLSTMFLTCIIVLYFIKMVSITKKYGPPSK